MQIQTITKMGFICLFMSFLCACSLYHSSSSTDFDKSVYLNKKMQLPDTMLLAETKHWNLSNLERYWVFSFAQKPYYTNYLNATVPTYADYQTDTAKWQRWQGDALMGWARFVGVLPKGTSFHIADIIAKSESKGYWTIIEIDSGEYKGKTAIFANSKGLLAAASEK